VNVDRCGGNSDVLTNLILKENNNNQYFLVIFMYQYLSSTGKCISKFPCRFPHGDQILYWKYGLILDDKWYNLEFLKLRLFQFNPARAFLIIFIYITFAFREKHGLVRNDFLDCMMELRKAGYDEVQGGVQSAKISNTGATFSKLLQNVILSETGY